MAKCPNCQQNVSTPFFVKLDAWRHLVCPNCKTRLEMKPSRSALMAPLIGPLFVLARQGKSFEVIAFAYALATIFLLLWESAHPKLQIRKRPLPEPEIRLKIDGSASN